MGQRKERKPRTHWQAKRSAAASPTQLCSVYMLGFGGLALLWLSNAAYNYNTITITQ